MSNTMGTMLFIQSQVGQAGDGMGATGWVVTAVVAVVLTLGCIWLMERGS